MKRFSLKHFLACAVVFLAAQVLFMLPVLADYVEPFTTSTNYTYNTTNIEVTANTARLKKTSLAEGLVGYWRMDEASWSGVTGEVKDSSGMGNDGKAIGGATTSVNGKIGRSAYVTGNQYPQISSTTNLKQIDEISLAVWVNRQNDFTGFDPIQLITKVNSVPMK